MVVRARFTDDIEAVLVAMNRAGRIVRGLEGAKQTLKGEERGLRMADRKSGAERGVRVSRLLVLSNDGSDGFYRRVETLLQRHAGRVMAIRVDADAMTLGTPLFGKKKAARLVMVEHKEAVAEVLLALADQFATS